MEYQLPFSLFFTLLIFMFMILRIGKRYRAKNLIENLPPGPMKLPFIGNLHQLVGSMPHHRLANLSKKYGPIMHLNMGGLSTIVVSSREAAKEVLHTQGAIFADRPFFLSVSIMAFGSTGIAFAPYGDFWRQMRKICILELLSAKRVRSFRSIREEEVSFLVNSISLSAGLAVNVSEKIIALTYGITSRAAFGGKIKEQEKFIAVILESMIVGAGFSLAELFPSIKCLQLITGSGRKMRKLHPKIDEMLENIVDEHRAKRVKAKNGETEAVVEDLVDVLLGLQEHGDLEFPLTNNNIKAIILDIILAGTETSSTAVEWAMSEMMMIIHKNIIRA